MAVCPRPQKRRGVKNPETGTYPRWSAYSCKSLQPQIFRKSAESARHFKGLFANGNVRVRILPWQEAGEPKDKDKEFYVRAEIELQGKEQRGDPAKGSPDDI